MPKNDNAHAQRFYASLSQLDQEAAIQFAGEHALSKSADFQKKFRWAREQCAFLEKRFSEDEITLIRGRCHCEAGKSLAERMRGYWSSSKNMEEFASLHNQKESYAQLEAVEDGLLLIYPQCYCACVKRVAEPISRTWCLCTLGYAKDLFSQVFGKDVEAQLLESVKTGGQRCVVKVTI